MVQDIKHGVRLVAGATKNSSLGHNSPRRLAGEPVKQGKDSEGESTDEPRGEMAKTVSAATQGSRTLPEIHLEVSRASAAAIEAVESQGGTVTCAHFNRLALRSLVRAKK